VQTSLNFPTGYVQLAGVAEGFTLARIRFGWSFYAHSPSRTAMFDLANDAIVFGLCTTVGTGSEVPPDPRSSSGDVDPPLQRWLWWEARSPVPCAIDSHGDIIAWRDTGPQEPCDAKGQVKATGLPGGETLNLWASWAAAYGWDSQGTTIISVGSSVLTIG
jgi:hypothetical protein